jgi:hypothetical protein
MAIYICGDLDYENDSNRRLRLITNKLTSASSDLLAKRKCQEPKTENSHIPEDEQWQLVQDSGILQDYDGPKLRVLHHDMDRSSAVEEPPSGDLAD